jgi:hypothetical protein
VAVDKVTSNNIAPSAVRSKHIKDKQVKTRDADLVAYRKIAEGVSTSSTTAVEAGPAITRRAKAGDLLVIQARVFMQHIVGAGSCEVDLRIDGDNQDVGSAVMTSSTFEVRWIGAGSQGANDRWEAEARVIPVSAPGPYTISLAYRNTSSGTSCLYEDRNLWVELVR